MIHRLLSFCVMCALALPAAAQQQDFAAKAQSALADLEAAAEQLNSAERARDRVRALTATILAFEDGLGAMREGLRQAAIQERVLSERLAGKDAEVASLLAVLQSMGRAESPTALLHPSGAVGTARAGMLLAEVGPALNARATDLRSDLEEVQTLRQLQQAAADRMAQGLSEIQAARASLNQAMAEREELPTRFIADPTRTAILIASAETLSGFASGLSQIIVSESAPPLDLEVAPGDIPLPVQGVILRTAGEADAAGVTRPGVLLATAAQALVTAPTAATIRYVGPLLDFGQVVILEPDANTLVILAGLSQAYGEAGQVIPKATPLGIMGGNGTGSADLLSPNGEGTGTERTETLYIEVRRDNRPVDPATWFKLGPED